MAAIRRCALTLTSILPAAVAMACASGQGGSAGAADSGGAGMWSGTFKEPQMAASAVMGPVTPARGAGYGTITARPGSSVDRVRVDVTIHAPSAAGGQVAWALFSGPCSAATPPVASVTEFPSIDVTSSGAGSSRVELPITLDRRTTYHANVYSTSRATDVSNVMMCADMKFGGSR